MEEVDLRVDLMTERNLMVRESILFVTNVTILDTLQEIAEQLKIRREKVIGEMNLYVSYAITLDTQQATTKWTEGTSIGVLIIGGTTT